MILVCSMFVRSGIQNVSEHSAEMAGPSQAAVKFHQEKSTGHAGPGLEINLV